MAVYNEARHLALSLEALARQRWRDFSLIVLDDGSQDGSCEIVESFRGRLELELVRAGHRGRHDAKKEVTRLARERSPYVLVLDADIVLAPDALAQMVRELDADPAVAAVSAHARAATGGLLGAGQAFFEDLFVQTNREANEGCRWIVGGCVLLRSSAIAGIDVGGEVGEDNELSERLREQWRLVCPRDLVAEHHGVPTTLSGVLRRGHREGVRVAALHRRFPSAVQAGTLARLVPLPLAAGALVGLATGQLWLAAAGGLLLGAHAAAFLWVSRAVPATPAERLAGLVAFDLSNLGFFVGYVEEALARRGLRAEAARPV